jgi:release factor glutamine methyltransferase
MITEELIDEAKRTLVSVNERFGYQGDEEDEAWDMLVHVYGDDLDWDDEISVTTERRFRRLIERRVTGEPIAYILGWVEFEDFRLGIKPGMFIPRLTSEFLAHQAIRRLRGRSTPVHVDLATGIGPVAITSARAVSKARVWGFDISRKAVNQGRANAKQLGLSNVRFKQSDLFAGLPRTLRSSVDVVTVHPPYVPRKEVNDLPHEIRAFEPERTLTDGSADGLGLLSRLIDESFDWLKPGGWLLIEIVPSETRAVMPLLRQSGYMDVRSTHGDMRHTRVITARV